MQYLGGKSRLAKDIAAIVAPRGVWWEPFCGGLSVSVQLAKYGPGIVSDACLPLISLYQAVRDGWDPPSAVSREEFEAAKSLPDTDPFKAFAGFGVSFAGEYFGSYTPGGRRWNNASSGGYWMTTNTAQAARTALLRDMPRLSSCQILCQSFFDVSPWECTDPPECIYADPPYAGATQYKGVEPFDHSRFWHYCQAWSARGVRVFVSEYACPVGSDVVWEKQHRLQTGYRKSERYRTERLFRVHPAKDSRVA